MDCVCKTLLARHAVAEYQRRPSRSALSVSARLDEQIWKYEYNIEPYGRRRGRKRAKLLKRSDLVSENTSPCRKHPSGIHVTTGPPSAGLKKRFPSAMFSAELTSLRARANQCSSDRTRQAGLLRRGRMFFFMLIVLLRCPIGFVRIVSGGHELFYRHMISIIDHTYSINNIHIYMFLITI